MVFGSSGDELYLTGVFVGSCGLLDMVLQADDQFIGRHVARAQDYEGFDYIPAHRMGAGHDCRLRNRRMLYEGTFNFKGADTGTRRR